MIYRKPYFIIFIMNKIMNYYYNMITEYINYNLLNKFYFEYQKSRKYNDRNNKHTLRGVLLNFNYFLKII